MQSQTLKQKANPPHFELRLGSSHFTVVACGWHGRGLLYYSTCSYGKGHKITGSLTAVTGRQFLS